MIISEQDIKSILPHRSPFLFVDEVVIDREMQTGTSALSFSNREEYWSNSSITQNDQDFLVLESAAQVFGVTLSVLLNKDKADDAKHLLLGFDACEFKHSVDADAPANIKVTLLKDFGSQFRGSFNLIQNDDVIASGELTVMQEAA